MLKLISIFEVNYESLVDYKMSFIGDFKEVSRVICMAKILNEIEYFEWLKRNKIENYYFMIGDDNPNYIIGDCMVNTNVDFHSEIYNRGAISYSIRPTERNKHYGTYMLKLLLNKCQEFGLKEVCVSCLESNLGSKKVIENNGGVLERRYFDIKGCDYGLKYWIGLEENTKILINK